MTSFDVRRLLDASLALGALMLAATSLGGCADEAGGAQPCTITADCTELAVCVEGVCQAQGCDPANFGSECGAGGVCTPGGKCTKVQCDCIDCEPCAEGLTCFLGLCSTNNSTGCSGDTCLDRPCTSDANCDTLVCHAGSGKCKPAGYCDADGDCTSKHCDLSSNTCTTGTPEPDTTTGCTADSCPDGQVCNETSGECEEPAPNGNVLCSACPDGDSQCAGGDIPASCVAFGGAAYCLTECTTNDDCQTGYQCFAIPGSGSRCIPGSGTCDKKCIQEGCDSGHVCEFDTGNCVPQLNACDNCTKDDYCGVGNRCVKFGPNDRRCVPQCGEGDECPSGSACTTEESVKVCKPTGAECCFGASCGGSCTDCPPDKKGCVQGQCVECVTDSHCGPGKICNTEKHVCEGDVGPQNCDNCTAPTPVCHPQLQKCVECLNSTHCGSGQICDPNTNTCTGDICAACSGQYPHCAEINGEKACVQCLVDGDCPSGAPCKNYWCEGGPVVTTGNCQTEGCPTSSQFTLACDQSTGLCYDAAGQCDNITAFCDGASGSECISIFDLIGGGGGAGVPLPDVGAFGICTCRPPGADIGCLLDPQGAVCLSKGACLGGVECGGLSALCGFGF
jgi:Cys-rich repeat protein